MAVYRGLACFAKSVGDEVFKVFSGSLISDGGSLIFALGYVVRVSLGPFRIWDVVSVFEYGGYMG